MKKFNWQWFKKNKVVIGAIFFAVTIPLLQQVVQGEVRLPVLMASGLAITLGVIARTWSGTTATVTGIAEQQAIVVLGQLQANENVQWLLVALGTLTALRAAFQPEKKDRTEEHTPLAEINKEQARAMINARKAGLG